MIIKMFAFSQGGDASSEDKDLQQRLKHITNQTHNFFTDEEWERDIAKFHSGGQTYTRNQIMELLGSLYRAYSKVMTRSGGPVVEHPDLKDQYVKGLMGLIKDFEDIQNKMTDESPQKNPNEH